MTVVLGRPPAVPRYHALPRPWLVPDVGAAIQEALDEQATLDRLRLLFARIADLGGPPPGPALRALLDQARHESQR